MLKLNVQSGSPEVVKDPLGPFGEKFEALQGALFNKIYIRHSCVQILLYHSIIIIIIITKTHFEDSSEGSRC